MPKPLLHTVNVCTSILVSKGAIFLKPFGTVLQMFFVRHLVDLLVNRYTWNGFNQNFRFLTSVEMLHPISGYLATSLRLGKSENFDPDCKTRFLSKITLDLVPG